MPCNCNPYHETERIQDKFRAVVYREKACTCIAPILATLATLPRLWSTWSTYKASATAASGPTLTDTEILKAAQSKGEQLIRTEWVGTDGLVWTWQDPTNVLDTRVVTYRTKRAALDAYADYLRMTGPGF